MITTSASTVETAVLAVLAGTPLRDAAAHAALEPSDLAPAVATYRAGGRAVLHRPYEQDWCQFEVEFTDWNNAEPIAVNDLLPILTGVEKHGLGADWWFIRKRPRWRFRVRATEPARMTETRTYLGDRLSRLRTGRSIRAWRETIYEPETCAFGGPHAMGIAHRLFHADSCGILTHLQQAESSHETIGRRELSLLICSHLLRSANQDWFEQGDVWHVIEDNRPLPRHPTVVASHTSVLAARRLLALDMRALTTQNGPLPTVGPWAEETQRYGTALARLARNGELTRGLRAVLAHHVIFHWNRLGIPHGEQVVLANTAHRAIFDPLSTPSAASSA